MRYVRGLSVALLVMLSVTKAEAQISVGSLKIESHPMKTEVASYSGQGGAFTFSTPSYTFTEYLAFCIDPTRTISVGSTYEGYKLFSFSSFVFQALNPNMVDENDLLYIASQAEQYDVNQVGPISSNNVFQKQIWDTYTGVINAPANSTSSDSWGVLANGKNQTFIVRLPSGISVPEPSTYALVGFGLLGLVFAARRRQSKA